MMTILFWGIGCISLIASLCIFVGQILCAAVPARTGAKRYAQAAVALNALGFLLVPTIVGYFIFAGVPSNQRAAMLVLYAVTNMIGPLTGLASLVVFMFFLKRLNQYVGNEQLVRSATTTIRLMAVTAVLLFFLIAMRLLSSFLPMKFFGIGSGIPFTMSFTLFALALLVTFVRFANLIIYTAKSLSQSAQSPDASFGPTNI